MSTFFKEKTFRNKLYERQYDYYSNLFDFSVFGDLGGYI